MEQKKRYHPAHIEKKWQDHWEKNKTFKVTEDTHRPKYYILDMFPYPSGAGLHVGHVEGYTATDIVARHKRQLGFNVLHPMGWDSFGLPAEQYALRTGTHPAITTQKNIDNYRRQLKSLGLSYDWDREFATSDPTYYKWTQWIFTKLFERGLAYEAEILVNYCPALGTVLANEEIIDGKSEIGGHPVERRPLKQWVLKITAYAEQLLEDLDLVDWPDHLKRLQRNWIGKSEGVEVTFKANDEEIVVFTTRADTLFGATYIVLSPEHPLVPSLTTAKEQSAVEVYCKEALKKSDMDRTDLAKDKTGVFTGSYAINPVNNEKIPVWIGDYVLMGYGTGAIMAVPAHDERDFEFAKKYHLNISPVFDPDLAAHPELIPADRTHEEIRRAVLAGSFCWTGEGQAINSTHGDLSLDGLNVEEAKQKIAEWLEGHRHGRRSVNYKLRDWLFSRQRYWGEPFPILHFEDGSKRALALDELPLTPPEVDDYKPAGDGRSPLAKQRHWVEVDDPKTGKKALRETNTMPQWAGSCWYYLRFCDPRNTERAWDSDKEKYWMPVDLYVGGVEHAVLHLLYARFWHKVLFDCGFVSTSEPFHALRNPGIITARAFRTPEGSYVRPEEVVLDQGNYVHAETGKPLTSQIEKMSKSKQNGVNPDEIIEEYGADAIRLYEMFMGPLEKEKIWNTDAVNGCRRFLNRFYDAVISEKVSEEVSEEALRLGHRLVDNVKKDISSLQFNTAIAKHMEFLNDFTKLPVYPRQVLLMATQALMPLAPHIAEEAWEILGGEGELATASYPVIDEKYLYDATITYVVQVNGKVRCRLELPQDQDQGTIIALAQGNEAVRRHLEGVLVVKVVFVPNKLLNFVTIEKQMN